MGGLPWTTVDQTRELVWGRRKYKFSEYMASPGTEWSPVRGLDWVWPKASRCGNTREKEFNVIQQFHWPPRVTLKAEFGTHTKRLFSTATWEVEHAQTKGIRR